MPSPITKTALLIALFGLTACGSATYQRVVSLNPSDASLYINGVRVGSGDKRPRQFRFDNVKRIYIQAVHPDYQPQTQWYTESDMRNLVATNTDLKITLRSR